jgi:hypothetical protein
MDRRLKALYFTRLSVGLCFGDIGRSCQSFVEAL